jgi:hypothetical protein
LSQVSLAGFPLGVPERELMARVSCRTESSLPGTSSLIVDLRMGFLLRDVRTTGSGLMAGAGVLVEGSATGPATTGAEERPHA